MSSDFNGHLPTIVGREQAESLLTTFIADINDPCMYGVGKWREMADQDPERLTVITPRVWAGIIHRYLVRDAVPRFEGRESEGVRVRPENESLMLIFGDILVARFKKVDSEFRPSNSPTDRQLQYERQTLKLEGLPDESTNITFGYLPNEIGTEVLRITAICWRIHRLEWVIPLYDSQAGEATLFQPADPSVPPAPERRRIIRPTAEPRRAEGQEGA